VLAFTPITSVASGTKKSKAAAVRTSEVSASTLLATKAGRAPSSESGGMMSTCGSTV
jgi:hypothetical protein